MNAAKMVPIRLQIAYEIGLRHPPMLGAFNHNQLVTCSIDGVTWKRNPMETCAEFEARVIEDIRQLMAADEPSPLVVVK